MVARESLGIFLARANPDTVFGAAAAAVAAVREELEEEAEERDPVKLPPGRGFPLPFTTGFRTSFALRSLAAVVTVPLQSLAVAVPLSLAKGEMLLAGEEEQEEAFELLDLVEEAEPRRLEAGLRTVTLAWRPLVEGLVWLG